MVSSSRFIILDLMVEIIDDGLPLQSAVHRHPKWQQLDARDRRFVRRMIAIVLRYRRLAQRVLARYLHKPLKPKDRRAEHVLVLGVAEMVWGDGAAFAVVDQAVRLMRQFGFAHLAGMTNAVLRHLARDLDSLKREKFDALDAAPPWLREKLCCDWPEDAEQMMRLSLAEPSLDFSCGANHQQWAERLSGELLMHGTIRCREGHVSKLDGYADGEWWVQDAAAAVPVLLLESAMAGIKGKNIVDICAAPGGKTAQLVALEANVVAVDQSDQRMQTLRQNMKRLKMSPQIVVADATDWTPDSLVDAVLVDAPCSATGTLRRHPDILCHDVPPDFAHLNRLQRELLVTAAAWLKPQGVLIYATCSLLKAEGELIVDPVPDGLAVLPILDDEIEGVAISVDARGYGRVGLNAIQTMDSSPNMPQGNDGFFIARFVKL